MARAPIIGGGTRKTIEVRLGYDLMFLRLDRSRRTICSVEGACLARYQGAEADRVGLRSNRCGSGNLE